MSDQPTYNLGFFVQASEGVGFPDTDDREGQVTNGDPGTGPVLGCGSLRDVKVQPGVSEELVVRMQLLQEHPGDDRDRGGRGG